VMPGMKRASCTQQQHGMSEPYTFDYTQHQGVTLVLCKLHLQRHCCSCCSCSQATQTLLQFLLLPLLRQLVSPSHMPLLH
jgi:hypothetical protein